MTFTIGFLVGCIVGACIGVVLFSVVSVSGDGDNVERWHE